ncbi:MAG: hypothetical protein U9P42_00195 [Candidatus Fermentibacteria bacterium]|nr:hypothetical protein [Candidatus Fermentibacteria bacterium]
MTGSTVRRCTKCILPENYPDVDLDSSGVCRLCREFDSKYISIDWHSREKKLVRMLNRYRGKGKTDRHLLKEVGSVCD